MTYAQTLEYLFDKLPMYQRIGHAAYKANLNSTLALMDVLDHPERKFKSIHVGGTNGKGSTAHLLASVFQEAGYKTGLYTSPHLLDFRERIRINGQMIPEAEVVQFVQQYQSTFEPLSLSFFEWSVGLAFQYFAKEKVDISIVEVGMGGRLDSTNVIDPALSVITNIGMDHSQYLGDTIAKIATEKAGIIKPNTPVVIGKSQRDTESVFRKTALEKGAHIIFADQQFPADLPTCPLEGIYQSENFQTVLVSVDVLKQSGWNITESHINNGFLNVVKNTGLMGRWQTIQQNPKVICDVGHNTDGVSKIVEQLQQESAKNLHVILGFVSDKDVKSVLRLFPPTARYYLTQPSIPRAMHIDQLSRIADEIDLKFDCFQTPKLAFQEALRNASSNDLIFIGGSTFVVADFLKN